MSGFRRTATTATIGITDYAQESLGDIVFVELPKVGAELTAGKTFGTVESVKAVSDLYAPASGTVTEVNGDLATSPEKVNKDRARLLDDEDHAEKSWRAGCAALRGGLREIRGGRRRDTESRLSDPWTSTWPSSADDSQTTAAPPQSELTSSYI